MFDSGFLAGVVVGIMISAGVLEFTQSYHRQAIDAKQACERTLPRDQVCKITAVPVDKEQK